jgi:hypothetical protein
MYAQCMSVSEIAGRLQELCGLKVLACPNLVRHGPEVVVKKLSNDVYVAQPAPIGQPI